MNPMSKLCDAADWFRPEVLDIIDRELREVPRFHRKQWESAMIVHTLQRLGKLRPDATGLSMGGGKELVLYAIAQHVRQLVVTDLYDRQTTWDCAKTDDPDAFIRTNKPFPVDDARLKVLRMDMRELEFPDRSFDFCYSTCAVEHIGARTDFLRHFNEVARVLADDGVYVFTTEVSTGDVTIRDEHNYVFSLQELYEMFTECALVPEPVFDAGITPHTINYPVPTNLRNLAHSIPELITGRLLQESPHIQLMRGKHPFTCGLFVLRRAATVQERIRPVFHGLEASQRFFEAGVEEYRALLRGASVSIEPFSWLPDGASRFFADHAEFFEPVDHRHGDAETVFHSDYFWLGTGRRVVDVVLDIPEPGNGPAPVIEVRVHRYATLASDHVDCAASSVLRVDHPGRHVCRLELQTDDEYNYAVLGKMRAGSCMFTGVDIRSYPVHIAPPGPGPAAVRQKPHSDIMRHLRSLWTS